MYYSGPNDFVETGRRVRAAVRSASGSSANATSSSSSSHELKAQMDGWAAWVGAHHDGLTGVLCGSRRAHSNLMKTGHLAQDGERTAGTCTGVPGGCARCGMPNVDFRQVLFLMLCASGAPASVST
jgi:hypothetical protein